LNIVVIDAGHGGSSPVGNSSPNNATGPAGAREKDLTLALALRTTTLLRREGIDVRLTRDTDANLGLAARAAVARQANAKAFLSIHFNGDAHPTTQGSETWVHSASTSDSRLLSASVQERLVRATGLSNRGVRSRGLGVLSLAHHSPDTAACLAEISFLTDPAEERRLRDDGYLDRIAAGLAQAILDYLNGATSGPAQPIADGDPNGDGDA
jgi:N-acetylmuramoyl-L-alanine amidase